MGRLVFNFLSIRSHTRFYHRYHVVWTAKDHYKVLHCAVRNRIQKIIRQSCSELGVLIVMEKCPKVGDGLIGSHIMAVSKRRNSQREKDMPHERRYKFEFADPAGIAPDPLADILREGARELLAQAVEAEVCDHMAENAHLRERRTSGGSRYSCIHQGGQHHESLEITVLLIVFFDLATMIRGLDYVQS